MANSLVQEMEDRFSGLFQVSNGRFSFNASSLIGISPTISDVSDVSDDQLIGFLYELVATISDAEDSWVPPAGVKKINSLSVVKSTSLQSIGNGNQGVFNQATIRVMQPVSMELVAAVRV